LAYYSFMRHYVSLAGAVIGAIGLIVAAIVQSRAANSQEELRAQIARLEARLERGETMRVSGSTRAETSPAPTTPRERGPQKTQEASLIPIQPIATSNVQAEAPVPAPPAAATPLAHASANGFSFDLTRCRQSAGTVWCDLTITNDSSRDRDLYLVVRSYDETVTNARDSPAQLYDNRDNAYLARGGLLGTDDSASNGGAYVRTAVPSRLTTKGSVRFDGVDASATHARLLRINFATGSYDWHGVVFRNVPLSN
jgi:hypothetical protein